MNDSQNTLAHLVRERAATNPDSVGYVFLSDSDPRSLNWAQLHRAASSRAAALHALGAANQPVLLALPSGLPFVESLFACWYAGAIAVPVSLPRHSRVKHRLDRIIADAGARFAIVSDDHRKRLTAAAADESTASALTSALTWIDCDAPVDNSAADIQPRAAAHHLAVLQYTSGSTGDPRGVMVTHANLLCNSAQIAEACGHAPGKTIGGWLPLYHDMGLVGLIQAAFTGARCVFMQPERFLMRPWLWLQMISDFSVCSSPAPNFAYDLCVERVTDEHKKSLDLTHWQNALNGSEPVRAETLDRFSRAFQSCGFKPTSFFPCYGLAEATLFATGPGPARRQARRLADGKPLPDAAPLGHVGCGRPYGDTQIAIVDPQTHRALPSETIGEIWITGGSVASGYWTSSTSANTATNNARSAASAFGARIADAPENQNVSWLRTGDLGMIADGELFITGRLRDLIIIAGRNLFPVDLERTVEAADPAIAPFAVAAFSTDTAGSERLIIAAEVRREFARPARGQAPLELDLRAIARRVRSAIASEHDVTPHEIVLLFPGALPRTTSGKLSRTAAREAYLNQTLDRLEMPCNVPAGA